jgi:hypothetical protein
MGMEYLGKFCATIKNFKKVGQFLNNSVRIQFLFHGGYASCRVVAGIQVILKISALSVL